MIKCASKDGQDLWVSICDDCGPNKGGYFCQVSTDEDGQDEIDYFVVQAEIVEAGDAEAYIRTYVEGTDYSE